MPIQFNCPHCGKDYRVADANAGKRFACKQCGNAIEVPAGGVVAAPPASPQVAAPPVAAPPAARGPSGRGPRLPGAGPRGPGGPRPAGAPGPRPGAPRPYGQQGMPMGAKKTSPMALTSMILFGVGFICSIGMFVFGPLFFLAVLCALVGLILGIVGLVQTKKGGRYKGFGLALAGTILNGLALGSVVLLFVLIIAAAAAVMSDPNLQRQIREEQQRQRQRGYEAPIHRTYEAPAHRLPDWAELR